MSGPKKPVELATAILSAAVSDITFAPLPDMRQLKAAFWTAHLENPSTDPEKVTASDVMAHTGDSRVSRWWGTPGFKQWFLNKDEWRARQEYLVMLAQDTAEAILMDPNANANAKVQLIKFLTESVGKAEARVKETRMIDAEVHKMSPEQLESFLAKNRLIKEG